MHEDALVRGSGFKCSLSSVFVFRLGEVREKYTLSLRCWSERCGLVDFGMQAVIWIDAFCVMSLSCPHSY